MPHFVPADGPFTCSECENDFGRDDLKMVYRERESHQAKIVHRTRVLCEDCGKLLLESLDLGK